MANCYCLHHPLLVQFNRRGLPWKPSAALSFPPALHNPEPISSISIPLGHLANALFCALFIHPGRGFLVMFLKQINKGHVAQDNVVLLRHFWHVLVVLQFSWAAQIPKIDVFLARWSGPKPNPLVLAGLVQDVCFINACAAVVDIVCRSRCFFFLEVKRAAIF